VPASLTNRGKEDLQWLKVNARNMTFSFLARAKRERVLIPRSAQLGMSRRMALTITIDATLVDGWMVLFPVKDKDE
jgi:hypothetical protein